MNIRKIKKLIKSPALFFKDARNNRIRRNLVAKHAEKIIAIGVSVWKREVFERYVNTSNVIYFGVNTDPLKIKKRVLDNDIKKIYFWGGKVFPELFNLPDISIIRVEDGFIRSIGLGAEHNLPYSLCFDEEGIYYDSRQSSRLETLIKNYQMSSEEEVNAKKLIQKIIKNKITKYNLPSTYYLTNIPDAFKKKVLVIGQVEDDQSIQFGCTKPITNEQLLHYAQKENPNSLIIYKPHPDVQKGLRKKLSQPKVAKNIVILDKPDVDLLSVLDAIDHVYTITSLTGFEALLRGKKVTTFGMPFYSGWGLTDDRETSSRRQARFNIEHVFYCAYVLYPQYFDFNSNKSSNINEVINIVIRERKINKAYKQRKPLNFNDLLSCDSISKAAEIKSSAIIERRDTDKIVNFSEFNKITKYGISESHIKLAKKIWRERPWTKDSIKIYSTMLARCNRVNEQVEFMRIASDKLPNDAEIQVLYCKLERATGSYDTWIVDKLDSLLHKDPSLYQVRYFLCEILWETQGVGRNLLNHIRILQLDLDKISKQAQMFICACYCELGYYSKAIDIYNKIKNNNLDVKEYYFVSALRESYNEGKTDKFDFVNSIFEVQNRFIKKILSTESYAIVGNAPSEVGTGNGSTIDDRDIVIRFNNYNVDSDYRDDYGSKANIWIKSGFYQDIERRYIGEYDLVIQSGINPLFRNASFEDFSLDFRVAGVDFTIIPPYIYYELISKLKTSPSAGLCILYWIYKIKGKIPKNNVFGFSFGNQKKNSAEHYFINTKSKGFYPHDWQREALILNEIIER
jgi:hypothetical protein